MGGNSSRSRHVSSSSFITYGSSSRPSQHYGSFSPVDLLKQKICAILSSFGSHFVYIFDPHLDDGAADDVDTVNLNRIDPYVSGQQFVSRMPNLLFNDLAPHLCFCGIGATIYVFEGISHDMLDSKYFAKYDDDTILIGVYSFHLSAAEYLTMQSVIPDFNKTHMNEVYEMQGRKCSPQAVQYGTNQILVFSTEIEFVMDYGNITAHPHYLVDFELYNTESNDSVKLPSLHVYRINAIYFALIDGDGSPSVFTPTNNIEWGDKTGFRSSFTIRAFTFVRDHTLPDFGGTEFCLDISSVEPKWELWRETFSSRGQHLGSRNGCLIFNSYGACEVGKKSVDVC